jgi:hypothetical protein
VIDYKELAEPRGRFKFQPELLQCGKERRSILISRGRGRIGFTQARAREKEICEGQL